MKKDLLFLPVISWLFGFLLLISGIWKLYLGQQSPIILNHNEVMTEFPDVDLPVLWPIDQDTIDVRFGRHVVAVFSPSDCGVCLSMLKTLNHLYSKENEHIGIVGIIDTPYRQAALKFQQVYNLTFPLLYDSLSTVKHTLDIDIKPALLFVDSGIIRKKAIVGASKDSEKVNEIFSRLNERQSK